MRNYSNFCVIVKSVPKLLAFFCSTPKGSYVCIENVISINIRPLRGRTFIKYFLLSSLFISFSSNAQNILQKTDDAHIQQQLENIAENTESEDTDYSNLLDGLMYYKEHPINLNYTDKEELQEIQLLNDIQINNLLSHIERNGKLITVYELQGIDGFDRQTIQKLLPYIRVTDNFNSPHFSMNEMFRNGQNILILRYGQTLEKQKGFAAIDSAELYKSPNSRYIGSPQKIYARYRFNYGTNISWGITAEKDQGELFFKSKQKFKYDWYERSLKGNQKNGFDFYSAHFYLRNIRFIKSLAVGDYQITFGQGLTAWSGYSFGKSTDIISTKKIATGIRPYTSVDENRFMRGVAATIALKKIDVTGFFSRKHIDANVSDTLENGEAAAVSSLQETGYHSTAAEISDKHSILQTIYGGNVSYNSRMLNVGLTVMSYQLDKELNRNLSYYNRFEFSSGKNFNIGLDYNFIIRNLNFFGEAAGSQNGGMAYLNGVLMSIDPRVSFTILHRYYQHNYQSLLNNGFSENTMAANEKGIYIGLLTKPTTQTTLTAYYDRFEFPWLKYQANAPSRGNDYTAQLNYTPSKKLDAYFRIRQRNKEKNKINTGAMIDYLIPVKQTNYRFHISYNIAPSVKLKNRVELIDYTFDKNKTQKGYLVYQDVTYNKMGKPFSMTLRYALFQTDNYDSRIYAYENDMPGSYSIPAYYNRGSRFYILFEYNITHNLELWFRYSQTFYDNKKSISEGTLTEIERNTKSEIKAQIRFKF
ncbi:MAG: helix-hairpin-helix domain-containing protein [Bacteroidota bacterium]